MKTGRAWYYLLGACLVLLLIVSQTGSAATSKPAASAVPVSVLGCPQGPPASGLTPQYGGTLKIIQPANPTNLGQPWAVTSWVDGQLSRFALEGLVGLDTKGNPVPQLATAWVSNPENKTITFTLRQGVKFQDGSDFNAAAAKWNLDKYRNGPKTDLKIVSAVDVIDDYHVRLTFSAWEPIFLSTITGIAGRMVSPTAAQKLGDAAMQQPVGTGPFKFVSFQPNVSLKYLKNENYWQKGLPYLDAVEINFVRDPVVAIVSFTKGEVHAVFNVSTSDAADLKKKGNIIDSATTSIRAICGDSKNPNSFFSNMKVRQAIAYAIDTNTIVNSVFQGFAIPTNQLAGPGATAYDATIKGYPYNPAKAKELLASAGYTSANPLTTKLVFATNPQNADLYTIIQGYLKNVGINMSLEPIDNTAYNKLNASGWNNHLLEMSFSYNGMELKYSTSLTQRLSAKQYTYVSIWTPDDFNKLYNVMLAERDMAKREGYYQQLNKLATDDYCLVVPLLVQKTLTVKSPNLHDFGGGNNTASEFLPETAWLSK